jgi:hypothetical protein
MDQNARAAFVVAQAACMNAKLASMLEQNIADRAAGRSVTWQPYDFEELPDQYLVGHNAVIEYLRE